MFSGFGGFFKNHLFLGLSVYHPQPSSYTLWKLFISHRTADYLLNCHYGTKVCLSSSFLIMEYFTYISNDRRKRKNPESQCIIQMSKYVFMKHLYFCSVLITEFTRLPKNAPKESRNFCRAPKVHEANSGYFFSCVSKISQGTTVKNSKFKIMCIICKCPSSRTL